MKKINSFFLMTLLCFSITPSRSLRAQALGLNNSTPNASAILDATSTSKGILIPRMTSAQRDAISSPATGLLVYVTDKTTGFFYYDGAKWMTMYSPSSTILRRKSADESVCGTGGACTQNTGTTLQNDDELVLPLQANQTYIIDGFLFMTAANATPDCKLGFTVPAGATMTLGFHANYGDDNTNIATDVITTSGTAGSIISNNGGKENPVFISGSVVMGANAGNLQLQWAQNSNSNGNTTTIKTNSYIRAILIQ